MKRRVSVLILAALIGLALSRPSEADSQVEVRSFLTGLLEKRAQALVTGTERPDLESAYTSPRSGALIHELGRIDYMQKWARARGLKIERAAVELTNWRIRAGEGTAQVSLIIRTALDYRYGDSGPVSRMGIGSWHWIELVRHGGNWQISREFYLDALGGEWTDPYGLSGGEQGEAARDNPQGPASGGTAPTPAPMPGEARLRAAAFAERYCGSAWGCGNRGDYHEQFRSYRHMGGDCANFASQVLTLGGGLKPDWAWKADGKPRQGSAVWVNAHAFSRHLANSGKGQILARGTYPKVAASLKHLQPGDIVAYQSKGTVTHVSVVTGRDAGGVPVVSAHTADRFRNPWDLGWDKETVFWLIQVRL